MGNCRITNLRANGPPLQLKKKKSFKWRKYSKCVQQNVQEALKRYYWWRQTNDKQKDKDEKYTLLRNVCLS